MRNANNPEERPINYDADFISFSHEVRHFNSMLTAVQRTLMALPYENDIYTYIYKCFPLPIAVLHKQTA